MVEYLYDAIRCSAGVDNMINAYITDELAGSGEGEIITDGCEFILHDGTTDKVISKVIGKFDTELSVWEFVIPAEVTEGLRGRYKYCIMREGQNLCFKQPIYIL